MTVGQIKEALKNVPDETLICLTDNHTEIPDIFTLDSSLKGHEGIIEVKGFYIPEVQKKHNRDKDDLYQDVNIISFNLVCIA